MIVLIFSNIGNIITASLNFYCKHCCLRIWQLEKLTVEPFLRKSITMGPLMSLNIVSITSFADCCARNFYYWTVRMYHSVGCFFDSDSWWQTYIYLICKKFLFIIKTFFTRFALLSCLKFADRPLFRPRVLCLILLYLEWPQKCFYDI